MNQKLKDVIWLVFSLLVMVEVATTVVGAFGGQVNEKLNPVAASTSIISTIVQTISAEYSDVASTNEPINKHENPMNLIPTDDMPNGMICMVFGTDVPDVMNGYVMPHDWVYGVYLEAELSESLQYWEENMSASNYLKRFDVLRCTDIEAAKSVKQIIINRMAGDGHIIEGWDPLMFPIAKGAQEDAAIYRIWDVKTEDSHEVTELRNGFGTTAYVWSNDNFVFLMQEQ